MALGCEFFNLVARKSAVAAKFPGGLDALAADQRVPNYTEDERLLRIGSMSSYDTDQDVSNLQKHGLIVSNSLGGEVGVLNTESSPDWIESGPIDGTFACWEKGLPAGPLVPVDRSLLARWNTNLDIVRRSIVDAGGNIHRECPDTETENTILFVASTISGVFLDVRAFIENDVVFGVLAERDKSQRRLIREGQLFLSQLRNLVLAAGGDDKAPR